MCTDSGEIATSKATSLIVKGIQVQPQVSNNIYIPLLCGCYGYIMLVNWLPPNPSACSIWCRMYYVTERMQYLKRKCNIFKVGNAFLKQTNSGTTHCPSACEVLLCDIFHPISWLLPWWYSWAWPSYLIIWLSWAKLQREIRHIYINLPLNMWVYNHSPVVKWLGYNSSFFRHLLI